MQSTIIREFGFPDGSCIGHFNDKSKDCKSCTLKTKCSKTDPNKLDNFYPKTDQDVIKHFEKNK